MRTSTFDFIDGAFSQSNEEVVVDFGRKGIDEG